MILAHTRRTGEEHVCDGAFRNEFQKRESMAARSRPGSKQARVLPMLGREEGATIAAIMRDPLAAALGPRLLCWDSAFESHMASQPVRSPPPNM